MQPSSPRRAAPHRCSKSFNWRRRWPDKTTTYDHHTCQYMYMIRRPHANHITILRVIQAWGDRAPSDSTTLSSGRTLIRPNIASIPKWQEAVQRNFKWRGGRTFDTVAMAAVAASTAMGATTDFLKRPVTFWNSAGFMPAYRDKRDAKGKHAHRIEQSFTSNLETESQIQD